MFVDWFCWYELDVVLSYFDDVLEWMLEFGVCVLEMYGFVSLNVLYWKWLCVVFDL